MKQRIFLSAALCILVVGCLKTRAELEDEQAEQRQQNQTVAQQKTVAQKSPPPADQSEERDEQMRELSGRVDSLENAVAQANANKQGDKDAVAKDKQAIDQKFVAYEAALNKMEAEIAVLNDEIAKLKAPPPEATLVTPKGKTSYEQAEEQFAGKKWKDAIVNYQKFRDGNPKSKLYADATYKIGVCFSELGMKDEARVFLEDVVNKFPNSKEAKKASFRLKSLK